jgi:hypothetical protein
MTLSETIASAEGRIHDVVESGRTRLHAVVDDAEKRVQASLPRLREQLDVWAERSFDDAERVGGYVTEGLNRIGARLPRVEMPFRSPWPEPEEVVGRWFDTTGRVLALQRKLALDWIAALRAARTQRGSARDDPVLRSA